MKRVMIALAASAAVALLTSPLPAQAGKNKCRTNTCGSSPSFGSCGQTFTGGCGTFYGGGYAYNNFNRFNNGCGPVVSGCNTFNNGCGQAQVWNQTVPFNNGCNNGCRPMVFGNNNCMPGYVFQNGAYYPSYVFAPGFGGNIQQRTYLNPNNNNGGQPQMTNANDNILVVARNAGNLNTFLTAVDKAGLTQTLEGNGPFTVFAPTDAAFNALPAGELQRLLNDPAELKQILLGHVVAQSLDGAAVGKLTDLTTLQGNKVTITANGGNVQFGNAPVSKADAKASNGVLHVIDTVEVPNNVTKTIVPGNTGGTNNGGTEIPKAGTDKKEEPGTLPKTEPKINEIPGS